MRHSPPRMDVWAGSARDTPCLDRVWPLAAASWKALVASFWSAPPAHAGGGFPHVGDRAVAHIHALASPVYAAFWPSQSLLVCLLGPPVNLMQRLFPFGSLPSA